ncbi:hypothetical protein AO068_25945 [Pseudomonas sp. ICMP 3272]|nr:hypothetical protein AO068_25945 [Pseudomonas sp. ICMP 3272]
MPRIGQEVLVTFLAGDIDRPLVTSVLYNNINLPPRFSKASGLPGNRTLSGIRTQEHTLQQGLGAAGQPHAVGDPHPGTQRQRLQRTAVR